MFSKYFQICSLTPQSFSVEFTLARVKELYLRQRCQTEPKKTPNRKVNHKGNKNKKEER